MYGRLITENLHVVPAINPVDLNTGANPGDYISLKNHPVGGVLIQIGAASGTAAVTLKQAKNVAGLSEKALSFAEMWLTGGKLEISGKTGTFTAGETITGGTSGATAVVLEDRGTYLLVHTRIDTAFTAGETITGGTSGYTAVTTVIKDEDILLRKAVAADTFTIPDVNNRIYFIPFEAMMLDVANDFDCIRVDVAQASGAMIGSAVYILDPSQKGRPMQSAIYD
jgi:hypothetical protein